MYVYYTIYIYMCVGVCVCECVCIGVSAYLQKHHPSHFFAKLCISQKTVKGTSHSASLLANLSLDILVFCKALLNQVFSVNPHKIFHS